LKLNETETTSFEQFLNSFEIVLFKFHFNCADSFILPQVNKLVCSNAVGHTQEPAF